MVTRGRQVKIHYYVTSAEKQGLAHKSQSGAKDYIKLL